VRGTSIGGGRAACQGRYRRGLVQAAKTLTPEEASVPFGLEAHGLDVNQLRDVLSEHVLVDHAELYELVSEGHSGAAIELPQDGRPAHLSGSRVHGLLVREKLHGRGANGTWMQ
jgi:hypothetical protein